MTRRGGARRAPIPIGDLKRIPQRPRLYSRSGNWPLMLRSVAEYVAEAPPWMARLKTLVDPYPKPFRRLRFHSADRTRLRGWIGVQRRGRVALRAPGLLIVPGLFSSKDLLIQRSRALKVFRDWGFHVFTMDLRGFGDSGRAYATAGWKEAEDIVAALDLFRRRAPLSRIHLYAESLGGTAALLATADAARRGRRLIDGSLVAVSPYADATKIVNHLSRKERLGVEFFMVRWFLRQLLHLGGNPHASLAEYARAAAQAYQVSLGELGRRSSPKHSVARVNVPTLILLSDDDPVVPSSESREFARRLKGRRNPALWRLPWGSHCMYEMADPDWFWAVLARVYSAEEKSQGRVSPGRRKPESNSRRPVSA